MTNLHEREINIEEIDDGEKRLREQDLIPDGFKIETNYDVRPKREVVSVYEYVSNLRALGKDVLVVDVAYDRYGKLLPTCVTILTKPREETT